ncbi:hypothetical protein CONPUDRAFT_156690 [Coniophora puteana RWD-64-598 SS2]|uniref:Ubiquitin-like protease family profile domain-containing protein n=1 Tax=Coniophora puteana (strain RWD-64-598) TaxID=741705 RepID=A0A5M3MHQ7_CONPW|nr:uncharacterized protein CONPUDRAFT_156690 [Coniophora puteana RWD-64-598 SS2]EIW78732.1 hypothetical protein CONPUDRAFT_156690 [Coniophora puteana RWD-64-598 SS2]
MFFDIVGWNAPLGVSGLRTLDVAKLLSNSYLSGNIVDHVLHMIRNWTTTYRVHCCLYVNTFDFQVPFLSIIQETVQWDLFNTPNADNLSHLSDVSKEVNAGSFEGIIHPLHNRHLDHYVAALFDTHTGQLSIGDLLDAMPAKAISQDNIEGYRTFAHARGLELHPSIIPLDHSLQDDGFSCSVVTFNMIEHTIFGQSSVRPWSPHTKCPEHAEWALLLLTHGGNPYALHDLGLPDNLVFSCPNSSRLDGPLAPPLPPPPSALSPPPLPPSAPSTDASESNNTTSLSDRGTEPDNSSNDDNDIPPLSSLIHQAKLLHSHLVQDCEVMPHPARTLSLPTQPLSLPAHLPFPPTQLLLQPKFNSFFPKVTQAEVETRRITTKYKCDTKWEEAFACAECQARIAEVKKGHLQKEKECLWKQQWCLQLEERAKRAAQKAQTKVTLMVPSKTTPPIQSATPKASRPFQQFSRLATKNWDQQGRKRKNPIDKPASASECFNYCHPLVFQQINNSAHKISGNWPPKKIVDDLKRTNPTQFSQLIPQTLGRWIECQHSEPPRWKDPILAQVEFGNKPQCKVTRNGILSLYPDLIDKIKDYLKFM